MQRLIYLISILLIIILSGCSNGKAKEEKDEGTYTFIEQDKAKEMMEKGNVIILDVRTVEEYEEGHIPKAILLPVTDIEEEATNALPDKNATILVYCRSGNRSKIASEKLIDLGYTNVYDFGGINTWKYDVTK